MIGEQQPEITTRLDHALENTRTGLMDTRRALKDLRAKQVEELGLIMALENLTQQAASRGGFKVELNLPDTLPETAIPLEGTYYRIAQESLENIVKHAEAKHVIFTLRVDGTQFSLEIEDNGSGFDFGKDYTDEGLGLQGMQERAEESGSVLEVFSSPGKGSRISITTELNHA
jgi:signal transduction histidine kinase